MIAHFSDFYAPIHLLAPLGHDSDYLDRKIPGVAVQNCSFNENLKHVTHLESLYQACHVTYQFKISSTNLIYDNGQPIRKLAYLLMSFEYGP